MGIANHRRRGVRCLVAGIALVLGGCAVGPDYHRPAAPEAKAFTPDATTADTAGTSQHFVSAMDLPGQWWTLFRSPSLNALLDDALAHNADVDAANAALQVAWENVYAQRGAYFPSLTAGVTPTRQDVANDVASSAASGRSLYSLTTAQVSIAYSPDLWGGNRRQVESLVAQAEAQRFQTEATYLTLTSNLVNAAIGEASLRAQLDATQRIIAMQGQVLDTVRKQYALGDVADAAVAAQVATLEQSRAALPPLRKQLLQQRDLLAALAGRTPDQPLDATFNLDDLHLPETLPLSLPAQLLDQRPDVRAAEEALHAASAQVGVAIANRLPNIQIDASFGSASEKASRLFTGNTGFWNLAGSVTEPLFDGGALKHKQRAAEAAYRQAAAQYRGTVIVAMQNVADTLHAIQADADALVAAERAEEAASRSLAIARRQLALGDLPQTAVLTAELTWQQASLTRIQASAARYADTVALFQALGGGWWHREDVPAQLSSR
ncbi:efflux transporter outer membrane subunit [Luteibacter sp. PPL201]|uniref:Efflux transporter outer membrane subunit n=1 Tax=Luteibacter sahnii TaxID=3021977 RepID=A0ABT6BCR0_9GAMM|nr:efflux transporter outer membrane subunit [Luteibacter sp. PPL193]MDY1549348.1 efflux transporter outer membrane subunit [Luteibacter sp. PPL193]